MLCFLWWIMRDIKIVSRGEKTCRRCWFFFSSVSATTFIHRVWSTKKKLRNVFFLISQIDQLCVCLLVYNWKLCKNYCNIQVIQQSLRVFLHHHVTEIPEIEAYYAFERVHKLSNQKQANKWICIVQNDLTEHHCK